MSKDQPTCGGCGVYRHLHPTTSCAKPRMSFWWDRHSLARHVAAWLWIHATPTKVRWRICDILQRRGKCGCELVDSWYRAGEWGAWKGDYSGKWGCLCDFPLPHDAGEPKPGRCYCPPSEEAA